MLFSWKACFSPSVQSSLRKAWVKNGGTLTHSASEFRQAKFFFCNGPDDPWLNELLSRSLVVRHATWISKCVEEQFLMPIAPYTLDDNFDQSKIEDILEHIKAPRDMGHQYNPRQPQDLFHDMLALYQSTPLNSLPAVALTTKHHPEERLHIQNVLKRPHAFDDDSYGKIALPPMKKQRIHPANLCSDDMIRRNIGSAASSTAAVGVVRQQNAEKPGKDLKKPQHVSPEPSADATVNIPLHHSKPDSKKSRNINVEPPKLPDMPSLSPKPRTKSTRTHLREKTNERFARLIKPFNPSSSPIRNTHPPRCTVGAHAHIHTEMQPIEPTLAPIRPSSVPNNAFLQSIHRPTLESAHTIFWNTARNSYADKPSGPLVVFMDDVLRAEAPTVRSTRFVLNARYLDKQFKCLAF